MIDTGRPEARGANDGRPQAVVTFDVALYLTINNSAEVYVPREVAMSVLPRLSAHSVTPYQRPARGVVYTANECATVAHEHVGSSQPSSEEARERRNPGDVAEARDRSGVFVNNCTED